MIKGGTMALNPSKAGVCAPILLDGQGLISTVGKKKKKKKKKKN